VSAGSTGATMAAAVFRLGRIEGIERPALGAHLVTATGPIMLLDVGANVDSDAANLVHFAVMGSIYAEHVLKVPRPRIGLLNIGEEDEKGDALSREANALMRGLDLNFVGNVEGNDLISHVADVVVCDGFVGNVVIKFFEGLTSYIFRSLRTDLQQGPVAPLALLALKPGFDRMKHRFDYERYGGAPLLGVRGVSIVTHGRAKARMVEHAMRVASEASEARIPDLIAEWSRRHPALARPDRGDTVAGGTKPLATGPGAEA
jgi:glycerol-3-phosphate acyltransferase PlsX